MLKATCGVSVSRLANTFTMKKVSMLFSRILYTNTTKHFIHFPHIRILQDQRHLIYTKAEHKDFQVPIGPPSSPRKQLSESVSESSLRQRLSEPLTCS